MKQHQMYPHNPNSAESILTEKLKDVSHGWVDNQRALVLEAMEQYAQQELQAYRDIIKELIPIASKARGLEFPGDEFVKAVQIIDRAKKLIDTVTPT